MAAFLIVGVISWGTYSQKSIEKRTAWEYMLVDYLNGEETQRKLNELGAQGWEVVGVSDKVFNQGNQTSTELVLKRQR
jgi:hypothetical protein